MSQLDLFSAAARHTDPPTSHAAAESLPQDDLSAQRQKVLAAVAHCDKYRTTPGATAYDAVLAMSVIFGRVPQQNVVSRRLLDLCRLGLVVDSGLTRPGSSNRELIVYLLTDTGRETAGA